MSRRTRITLGVGALALLLPVQAQAASGRVRVLNAAPSGTVSLLVDGKPTAVHVVAGGVSKRLAIGAGVHSLAVARGTRTIAGRTLSLRSGQRLTLVLTVAGGKSALRLLRESAGVSNGTLVRVANYASRAGPVDVRAGAVTIATALGVGHTSAATRVTSALSPTGSVRVSARRRNHGTTYTARGKLILATRSTGLFALVPTTTGARLIRLPYDVTPPVPRRMPPITGTRRFNHTITCGRGSWTPPTARTSRRWTVDGVPLGGGATLRLTTTAHAGHVLGCVVSATSHGMTTRVRTSFRLPSVPRPIVPPAILVPDGALQATDPVTCEVGKWTGDATDFAFRWIRIRDGQLLATTATYVMRLSDNGLNNVVACVVTATNDGGASQPAQSLNSVALDIPPTITILSGPTRPVADATSFGFFKFAIGGGGADTVAGTFDGAPVTCDRFGCQVDFPFNNGPDAVPHTFVATATNAAGATSTPAWKWSVNPPRPDMPANVVAATPNHTINPVRFSWSPTGGTAKSVECKVDTALTFTPCTGASTATADVLLPDPPPNGANHTIQIRTVNAAGASPAAVILWLLNPIAPGVQLTSPQPTNGSPTFTWTLTGGAANVSCRLDIDGVQGTAPDGLFDCSAHTTTSFSGLAAGHFYAFTVSVSNSSGSGSASVTWSF